MPTGPAIAPLRQAAVLLLGMGWGRAEHRREASAPDRAERPRGEPGDAELC